MDQVALTKVVKAISSILPKRRPLGHHEPYYDIAKTRTHLDTFLSKGITDLEYTRWFEDKLRICTGAEQVIALCSGTSALQLALRATGVQAGDEVLVPSLTYAATANAVVHIGAIPNFIDGRVTINPFKLERYLERTTKPSEINKGRVNSTTGRPVTALIMVHLLGLPCFAEEIKRVCNKYSLILIEDAAEALGSRHNNISCGNMGDMAILSFNHNKIITTGGGGALLSNDPILIATAYDLAHQSRLPHSWDITHTNVGYNFALPAICAALGVAQLEQLDEILERKRKLALKYQEALEFCEGVKFMLPTENCNNWLNTVFVTDNADKTPLLQALHDEGIQARAMFTPLHMLPMYENNPRDRMGYCEDTYARAICLPSGAGLI